MNIIFNKITLHNFGSYNHAEVELKDRGFCIVKGQNNYKKDKALSNGSGKSFLWSGICFALTGETIGGLSKNLKNINNDEEDSYTSVNFNVDADEFTVTRYIAPKSDLKIIKNKEDISGKGIRESEKILAEVLPDLDKDLISTMIILGQGMPNKFSSFSPSGRKELLEKLTKSDFMIEDLKNRIKTRSDEIHLKLNELHDQKLIQDTNINVLESSIKNSKNKLSSMVKPDFDKEKEVFQTEKAKFESALVELSNICNQLNESYRQKNENYLKVSMSKNQMIGELQSSYNDKILPLRAEQNKLQYEIDSLEKEIRRLKSITDICPTCHQKIIGKTKPDTTEQEKNLQDKKSKLAGIVADIKTADEIKLNYSKDIDKTFTDSLSKAKSELSECEQNKKITEVNKKSVEKNLRDLETKLIKLDLEKSSWDKTAFDLQKDIEISEEKLKKTRSEALETEKAYSEWASHLAVVNKISTLVTRDFRGYILSNIINYIDIKAKEYSDIVFGTKELNIYLDGNALDISYCNKPFDGLSGGEKQRVDLILQFAIRDMLSKYFNICSNIIVLDEITDFLDKISCEAIMNLIKSELNTTESVFIISHHPDELELPIDSDINIIKNSDGISTVL